MTTTNQKLTKDQRKTIAYKKYAKIANPAWKEYMKIRDIAYKKYNKIRDTAYEEYEKINNPANKEYRKKIKEIDNEPEEVEEIIEHKGRKYKLVEEQSSGETK